MDYRTWKQTKDTNKSTSYDRFLELMKQYGFHVVNRDIDVAKWVISGVCNTPSCENMYKKRFSCMSTTGPYCSTCAVRSILRRGFIIDEFPKIVDSIIGIVENTRNIQIEDLTSGSQTKVKCKCDEKCLRCGQQHIYVSRIDQRVSGRACPICAGKKNCSCQQPDEFRCFQCKMIKSNSQKVISQNYCKSCCSRRHDGNLNSFAAMLMGNIKQRKSKSGNLTQDNILTKYHNQHGKCFISNIPLIIGRHHSWQLSVERIDQNGKYDDNNTVLICLELQSPHRQWNKELWDEFCSFVKGSVSNLPNEDEYLYSMVQNIRSKKSSRRTATVTEVNNIGQTKCKMCLQWLDPEDFSFSMLKIGYCKKCQRHKKISYENTLMGRIVKLWNTSKINVKNRKGQASVHDITVGDILHIYLRQKGRCLYTNIPLCFSGFYQMSLERKDVHKGYIKDNICLIILPLNVSDQTVKKSGEDDDRDGFSGWNREKILWAVEQNPEDITPMTTTIQDFLSK